MRISPCKTTRRANDAERLFAAEGLLGELEQRGPVLRDQIWRHRAEARRDGIHPRP